MTSLQSALDEIAAGNSGPFSAYLRQLEAAAATANKHLTDILFGLGGEGDVTFAPGPHTYSGLHDVKSFHVPAGVTLSPNPNEILVVRSRTSIIWDGNWLADAAFPQFGQLVSFGSLAQSSGGGGGGGGQSDGGNPGQSGQSNFGGGGGGGQIGYDPGVNASPPAQAGPGAPGNVGNLGTPGAPSPYGQGIFLGQFPDALGALTGTAPGAGGQNGSQGGQGGFGGGPGNPGNGGPGGNGGQGGAAGGLLILISPVVTLNGSFHATGTDGLPGSGGPSSQGGNADGASLGGGGGGGGGGSGGQGGNAGVIVVYYRTYSGTPTVVLTEGQGGPGGPGGPGGAGDGAGSTSGAVGGNGATGPAGGAPIFYKKQILT